MKVGLICSHGGHLTETLQLLEAFRGYDIFFATYRSAREEELRCIARAYFTTNIGTSISRMVCASVWALYVLLRERPQALVSFGSEIALPFFYLAKLFRIKTIFIESWCRVEDLSRTGRLVYRIADAFWVQWPQLLEVCDEKAQFKGAVI